MWFRFRFVAVLIAFKRAAEATDIMVTQQASMPTL